MKRGGLGNTGRRVVGSTRARQRDRVGRHCASPATPAVALRTRLRDDNPVDSHTLQARPPLGRAAPAPRKVRRALRHDSHETHSPARSGDHRARATAARRREVVLRQAGFDGDCDPRRVAFARGVCDGEYVEVVQERDARASVRLVLESGRPVAAVAADLGVGAESLRTWVRQARTDADGGGARLTSSEREELAGLGREVKDLRRANEILKAASVFVAGELDPRRSRCTRSLMSVALVSGSSRSAGCWARRRPRTTRKAGQRSERALGWRRRCLDIWSVTRLGFGRRDRPSDR